MSPTMTAWIGPWASRGVKKARNWSTVTAANSCRSIGRQRRSLGRITPPSSRCARAEAEEKLRSKLSSAPALEACEQRRIPARMGQLGGEQAQLVDEVGLVGLTRQHERILVDAEGEADPAAGQQPLHALEVETGQPRGRDQAAEPAERRPVGGEPGQAVAEAQPHLDRAALEIGLLEGQGRAVGEADDGDVQVLDPLARDLPARRSQRRQVVEADPRRPSARPARSPAPRPAPAASAASPPSTGRGETSSMRGPEPVNSLCIAAPTRSGVINGALRSKLSSTVCAVATTAPLSIAPISCRRALLRAHRSLALHRGGDDCAQIADLAGDLAGARRRAQRVGEDRKASARAPAASRQSRGDHQTAGWRSWRAVCATRRPRR